MPNGEPFGPFGSGSTSFPVDLTIITREHVRNNAPPSQAWSTTVALTNTTPVALAAAAGVGLERYLTSLQAVNTGASAVDLIILDGATERWRLTLPVNVPINIVFPTELVVSPNTALNANLSATGTVRVSAQGYTAP